MFANFLNIYICNSQSSCHFSYLLNAHWSSFKITLTVHPGVSLWHSHVVLITFNRFRSNFRVQIWHSHCFLTTFSQKQVKRQYKTTSFSAITSFPPPGYVNSITNWRHSTSISRCVASVAMMCAHFSKCLHFQSGVLSGLTEWCYTTWDTYRHAGSITVRQQQSRNNFLFHLVFVYYHCYENSLSTFLYFFGHLKYRLIISCSLI